MQTREESFEALQQLTKKYSAKPELADANEAETRLLLIDEVLQILGWKKEDFHPETQVGTKGYTDYSLGASGVTRIIVEAKRIGTTFTSPRMILHKNEYDLTYTQAAFGATLSEVLGQAGKYCTETRVPYAAITNGAEWIIAQLIAPPGRALADLKCFYAGNLLRGDFNFQIFWQLLGKASVLQGSLEEAFDELNRQEFEFCRDPRGILGDWMAWASPSVTEHLREFYHRFFDEIVDPQRRMMLDHCYVSNSKLDQYESAIKRTLEDSAPQYIEDAQELQPGETQRILTWPSGDRKGRVVLIVGSVGAGKTTFVTKVMLSQSSDKTEFILLDLIDDIDVSFAALWTRLYEEVKKRSGKFEYEFLRKIFHKQLEALKKGPEAKLLAAEPSRWLQAEASTLRDNAENSEIYLEAVFRWSARERTTSVVFLDNVDRLSEPSQREVYAFAHKLASRTGCAVIVPLRETTYYRAKEEGFLDVRSSDVVFHLQSPDLVQVISKRIQYIEFQLSDATGGERDPRIRIWRASEGWNEFVTHALKYCTDLKLALLQHDRRQAFMALLAAIAWHNVRQFFRCLRHVHGLAHGRKWDMSSLVGALMIPEDGSATPFLTSSLFALPAPRHLAHFLRIRLLAFLISGVSQWEAKAGVNYFRILGFLRSYGYRKQWIDVVVTQMVKERLVECLEVPVGPEFSGKYELDERHSFRASPLAVLLLRELQLERPLLAAMGWTMSFLDEEYLQEFILEANVVKEIVERDDKLITTALAESRLPEIMVAYLHDMLDDESIINATLLATSDITRVEQELERLRHRWELIDPDLAVPLDDSRSLPESHSSQMSLPHVDPSHKEEFSPIGLPRNIGTAKLAGTSRMGALILWAIVAAKANRRSTLGGSELAEIINRYTVGEQSTVLGTNVSRALRSKLLGEQHWLKSVGSGRGGRPRYTLVSGWEDAWRDTFEENPPSI